MNRTELIQEAAAKANMTQKQVKICLQAILGVITKAIKIGDVAKVTGFGRFYGLHLPAKTIKTNLMKKARKLPGRVSPRFKSFYQLTSDVNK
jgi:DNA-binding protein HU-beta